jgi:hypothetical protein
MIASSVPIAAQVQYRAGACEQKKRLITGPTAAQMGNHSLLRGLIQPLFDHVDDQDGRTLGFQSGE